MSLVAPLYLAALAALALPWLLHRFSDARPDERPFPSARFLEPTPPPVSRRRTLRHRALLALRALALIALCVLFAEPWIPRPEALADARRLHVVAVDTSLSMRAGTRAERALAAARERLEEVAEGDSVQLVAFDREATLVTPEPLTASEAMRMLARAGGAFEPGFAASDYGRLMQRLDRLADESALPVQAVLVTDAQRSALPDRRNALYAPRLDTLALVDVGADEANLALDARAASEDGAQARIDVTISASGSGAEGDPAFERVVTLGHDGEQLAQERVRLAPGERESIVFERVTLPEVLAPRFDIAFEEADALAADDAVSVPVRLDGARSVALAALDARVPAAARVFVATALEADGTASVDTSTLAAGQLPEDAPRLVVFVPLAGSDTLPAALQRFIARGGGALVVDAAPRDTAAGGGKPGERRDGADTDDDADAEEALALALRGSGVGRIDETHPLALGDIDWADTRFFALGEYAPGEADTVLIETEDRRPVLIERASEAGLALILNERLDGIDSNLPFQPAFVTLMRHVVEWFDSGRAVPERVTVGDDVALPVNVQVLDPDGRALVALADTASAQTLAFDLPGLYTVVGALGEQTLSVALAARESNLATIPPEELAAWTDRHAGEGDAGTVTSDGNAARADTARADAKRIAFWPFLLPLLAALLLAETLFANRRLDVRRDGS